MKVTWSWEPQTSTIESTCWSLSLTGMRRDDELNDNVPARDHVHIVISVGMLKQRCPKRRKGWPHIHLRGHTQPNIHSAKPRWTHNKRWCRHKPIRFLLRAESTHVDIEDLVGHFGSFQCAELLRWARDTALGHRKSSKGPWTWYRRRRRRRWPGK